LLVEFLMEAILTGTSWNHSMFFHLYFLYNQGWWLFFHVFFSFLPFKKFSSVAHFFIVSLIFWEFYFLSSLCILVISPLLDA
jgi:hypothetical protein